jgi:N-glycosylase/DNA lyase
VLTDSIVPLNLDLTIDSGQVFLWNKLHGYWYGIHGSNVVRVSVNNGALEFSSYPENINGEHVFRFDDNLNAITRRISKDNIMKEAVSTLEGLRLMRQEPYQCLLSFICATNTSIAMIRRMLTSLSARFGRKVEYDGHKFYLFPEPRRLADASINDLCKCSVGYRARFIKQAARVMQSRGTDFENLKRAKYEDAKEQLMDVLGIGQKVADCILLFSLEKLEAFPIDIWVARAISNYYSNLFDNGLVKDKISPNTYRLLSAKMREYFGSYAGYAQQYLYCYARNKTEKRFC